jgi:glutamyl-tRNA reductase
MGKELNNLKNKITKNEYEKVAEFANFLNRSYIGLIIKNLKTLSKNGSKFEYINLVNNLFELQGD